MSDLHNIKIKHDGGRYSASQENNNLKSDNISVYFKDIKKELVTHIRRADAVIGCTAWLTDYDVLDELAKKDAVQILVQKEDFLRPDSNSDNDFKSTLRRKYNALPILEEGQHSFENILVSKAEVFSYIDIEPVRCVGNHNADKLPASPRMHNKFLLFCKYNGDPKRITPYAVWTGSYNITMNATKSFENAIYTEQNDVVQAYYKEYGQIVMLSEPLDWELDWCSPEYYIGT